MRFAVACVVLGIVMIIFGANMGDTDAMKPSNKPCFYTQATALNVRQSPNKESQILQTLPRGHIGNRWSQTCGSTKTEASRTGDRL